MYIANCPLNKIKIFSEVTIGLEKIFQMMHGNICLNSHETVPLTLSLTGGWRILPTNFKTLLSQNNFKLKKSEKKCNPSLLSYGHFLLKRTPHTMPFYAFFCLVLPKNLSLWSFFEAVRSCFFKTAIEKPFYLGF